MDQFGRRIAEDVVDNVPRDALSVWNLKEDAPAVENADDRKYLDENVEKALTGSCTVKLSQKTGCKGQ